MTLEQHQLATVARSKLTVDRAREYAAKLAGHAAGLRSTIVASQAAAVTGEAAAATDAEEVRGELAEVDRQHRLAAAAFADADAEHARHLADLDTMLGPDRTARAALADAQQVRAEVQAKVDGAVDLLTRAQARVGDLRRKLVDVKASETKADHEAAERLRLALQNGDADLLEAPVARASIGLEENIRVAEVALAGLAADHAARLADLKAADTKVSAAVDAVLLAEAEAVARELEATETRAAMLRRRLKTYAERAPVGHVATVSQGALQQHPQGHFVRDTPAIAVPATVKRSPLVTRLLGPAATPLLGSAPVVNDRLGPAEANWSQEATAWSTYASALTADATAEPAFALTPAYVAAEVPSLVPAAFAIPIDPHVAAFNQQTRDAGQRSTARHLVQ